VTLDATQWELALHSQDARGAAEGLRRATRGGQEGEGACGASQGRVARRVPVVERLYG
jgi:hypothetical protein